MRTATLDELAAIVGGEVVGPGQTSVFDALPLQDARPGTITLADHTVKVERIDQSTATAVVVSGALANCQTPMLVVPDIHAAFQKIIAHLRPNAASLRSPDGIHPTALIEASSSIGSGCRIGAYVTIAENCHLGDRCTIHQGVHIMADSVLGDDCEVLPNCVLYPDTKLGQRVVLHAGTVLGAYGFGYHNISGRHQRSAQLGWVEIDDDVEIGAGSTVDRGTYGPTRIGSGTKIDNQVQIGHNCHIGKHNLICAQVGIAGSSSTGDYVVLAGQVGVCDHVHLADGAAVGAKAGVVRDVNPKEVVVGTPAMPRHETMQQWAALQRLPSMRKELKTLTAQFEALKAETLNTIVAAENRPVKDPASSSNCSAASPSSPPQPENGLPKGSDPLRTCLEAGKNACSPKGPTRSATEERRRSA